MSKGVVTKVMKYELRYIDGCGDFHEMQNAVWKLQKQSREIMNKTLQLAFHWDFNSKKHFDDGLHPNDLGHRIVAEKVVEFLEKM